MRSRSVRRKPCVCEAATGGRVAQAPDPGLRVEKTEKVTLPEMTNANALRLAINVLRDSAEPRRMPSGPELDDAAAGLNARSADVPDEPLEPRRDHEHEIGNEQP